MTQDFLLDIRDEGIRFVIMEDGEPVGFMTERDASVGQLGSIYRGIVTQVMPGLQAAFVDIGLPHAGFLHARDAAQIAYLETDQCNQNRNKAEKIENIIKQGQELTVQIVRESFADKGPKLTVRWTVPGSKVMLVPGMHTVGVSKKIKDVEINRSLHELGEKYCPAEAGIVMRTAAENTDPDQIIQEIHELTEVLNSVKQSEKKGQVPRLLHADNGLYNYIIKEYCNSGTNQIIVNHVVWYERLREAFVHQNPSWGLKVRYYGGEFELLALHGVESELSRALSKKVWLKSGATIHFDYTEAMTVVDVNSGKNQGKKDHQETFEEINREAVEMLVRQVRLRNIGGILVVDFIDMASGESRQALVERLREKFSQVDGKRTTVLGITALGLVEITRKRIGQPLYKTLKDLNINGSLIQNE